MPFTKYRRTQIAEMEPWSNGYDMMGVSISVADSQAGSPKPGDMIARNPKNHDDKWLVAAQYFADNFEPLEDGKNLSAPPPCVPPGPMVNRGRKAASDQTVAPGQPEMARGPRPNKRKAL
jgi:hypothetical protein